MTEIKEGMRLFSLNVGNAARYSKQELTPVIVTKVGRKYFWCENEDGGCRLRTKYNVDGWKEVTNYSVSTVLYESKIEWENEQEATALLRKIKEHFSHYGRSDLPLVSLRQIASIIDWNEQEAKK